MMKTILFMCMGNACRSQIAEGYARKFLPETWRVLSAGVIASGVHPMTIEIMHEDNIDISGHTSKTLNELGKIAPDIVITLCDEAEEECPNYPGMVHRDHWGIEDPVMFEGTEEERLNDFRRARNQIKEKVQELAHKINN